MSSDGTVINFDKLKSDMKYDSIVELKLEELENKINTLVKEKKYKEALDLSVKTLNEINEKQIENDKLLNKIKSHVIKLNNINGMNSLQKGEIEMAKYFLDMSEKFLHKKDLESYVITKNNFCCYHSNTGQFRSAKNTMSELLKLNILKKVDQLNQISQITENTEENEKKENPHEENAVYNKDVFTDDFSFANIANDYSNICALNNKLKNYTDSLSDGLHALALTQLTVLNDKLNKQFNKGQETEKTVDCLQNNNLVLAYYNLGVQQEFLKREHDSQVSFYKSTLYVDSNKIDKTFSKKVSTNKNSISDDMNFKDSFSSHDLSALKYENMYTNERIAKMSKIENMSKQYKKNPYFVTTKKNFDKYKSLVKSDLRSGGPDKKESNKIIITK